MVGGGGGGGVRMVVQIEIVNGSYIWWLWMEVVMMADGGGSGV